MRSAAPFVLVIAACVGLPPSPPQHDDGTATDQGSSTMALDSGVGPNGDDATDSTETGGPQPLCGNAVVVAPEECDLGELNGNGMYCTGTCTINRCGDGYVGPGEECDDGLANGETGACLPSCAEASCGDGFVHLGVEICDGTNVGANSCVTQGFDGGTLACAADCDAFDTSNCQLCGNGVIEPGEACDTDEFAGLGCSDFAPYGSASSGGALMCAEACTLVDPAACTFCGDGVREGSEQCDLWDFGGATCTSVAGPPYRGQLSCFLDCIIDTAYCCLGEGVMCGNDAECCSGTCNPMTSFCGP